MRFILYDFLNNKNIEIQKSDADTILFFLHKDQIKDSQKADFVLNLTDIETTIKMLKKIKSNVER